MGANSVNQLREALGDSVENPRFVETFPRKGYRFVAPVKQEAEKPEEPRATKRRNWVTARRQPIPQISAIAVIPLENLSHDSEQEYFTDGITDTLITDLAKVTNLRVISRTSMIRYKSTKKTIKDIGRELNVDAVVEGTVTRSGNRVRITAQLIQVSTDMHLWAEAYERDLTEILAVQNEVATDIARRVSTVVRPLGQAKRVNAEAYGSYLQGRYYFYQYTSRGWQQAIDHFNQAIESDPNFAPAYSGLADAYIVAGAYRAIPGREALARGKAAAAHAVELDDKLASAHYALATAYAWFDWNWEMAEKEFQRGLELDPDDALGRNWYGGYLSLRGRHDEAIDQHERARELDPFSLIVNANLVRSLYWARRYDDAIEQAQKTLKLDPSFGVTLFWLEDSLRHQKRFQDAVALRLAFTTPKQAQNIKRTFKSAGFEGVLRDDGESFKNSGDLIPAARCFAQAGDKNQRSRCLRIASRIGVPRWRRLKPNRILTGCVRRSGFRTCSKNLAFSRKGLQSLLPLQIKNSRGDLAEFAAAVSFAVPVALTSSESVSAKDRPTVASRAIGLVRKARRIIGDLVAALDIVRPVIGRFGALVAVDKPNLGQVLPLRISEVVTQSGARLAINVLEIFGLPRAVCFVEVFDLMNFDRSARIVLVGEFEFDVFAGIACVCDGGAREHRERRDGGDDVREPHGCISSFVIAVSAEKDLIG